MYPSSLSLFLFFQTPVMFATLPRWVFFREQTASCCDIPTQQNPPALVLPNKRRCVRTNVSFTLKRSRNTQMYTVSGRRLVDCHYRTLHSKCAFSRQTSNVFFSSHCLAQGNCSQALFTCIRLSFIWIVNFILLDLIVFVLMWLSERFLPRFSPCVCLQWGIVYLVIYAVRLSLSTFPLSISIQKWELCVVQRNNKHTSSLTLNTLPNSCPTEVHTWGYAQVLFAFLFSSALREFCLSSVSGVHCFHSERDVWGGGGTAGPL